MNGDKELIRQWLKTKRMAIPKDDISYMSQAIIIKLESLLNWDSFKKVHCYESIDSLNEIDTGPLIEFLSSKNIQVYMQDQSPFAPLPEEKFDLIIVPTLGFDRRRTRMGWGGGYYDRLLDAQASALKVGLCYQNGFVPNGLPREEHDKEMDIIITEENIYKLNMDK